MKALHVMLALACPVAMAPAVARPSRPAASIEAFTGKFHVEYVPIRCVRAPCPPGSYRIVLPDRPAVLARSVDYDAATPVALRVALRGAGSAEGVGIDGRVRFVRLPDGRTIGATMPARRAIAGRWKP